VPDVSSSAVDDLRLVEDRPAVQAVLAALPPIYRHGLAAGLTSAGLPCTAVGSAGEVAELLATSSGRSGRLEADDARCVVVVPAEHFAAVLTAVRDSPDRSVDTVVVVEEVTTEVSADVLKAGATGVVARDAELAQVLRVVRAAAIGHTVLPRQVARGLCRSHAGPAPELLSRERSWLRHLADSGTVASLAATAGYSEREMYRLLGSIYTRLGASNRTEALLLAERWGLLQTEAP
jgi:DNA-binding NarL/FixJ family response regulator